MPKPNRNRLDLVAVERHSRNELRTILINLGADALRLAEALKEQIEAIGKVDPTQSVEVCLGAISELEVFQRAVPNRQLASRVVEHSRLAYRLAQAEHDAAQP